MPRLLIVKLSSLGDIAQVLPLLDALHAAVPFARIDWACEEEFAPLLRTQPGIHHIHAFPIRRLRKTGRGWKALFNAFRSLRHVEYDTVFDLQGNCKSALITYLARAQRKIGFGPQSARERPNTWVTTHHVEVPRSAPIRAQYLSLIQSHFPHTQYIPSQATRPLNLTPRILVCPGTTWKTKQLPLDRWRAILAQHAPAAFLYIWGTESEKQTCLALQATAGGTLVDKLTLPALYQLIRASDRVLAVDSGLLHLAAAAGTPTTSYFGPTLASVFAPQGALHLSHQGTCPYGLTFDKQCPRLRTCPTGACML